MGIRRKQRDEETKLVNLNASLIVVASPSVSLLHPDVICSGTGYTTLEECVPITAKLEQQMTGSPELPSNSRTI